MSGVLAVWHRDGRPVDPTVLPRAAAALRHRGGDREGLWSDGDAGLAHHLRITTPESARERQPVAARQAPVRLVADARLDNRDELLDRLGLSGGEGVTDPELILAAYLRWGDACPEALLGDFAFVVVDGRNRSLFFSRDPMGVRPLVYHLSADLVAVASEVEALLQLPGVPDELDEDRVRAWLEGDLGGREETVYRHILRLPAAHALRVFPERHELSRYWAIERAPEVRLGSDEAYVEAFLDVFRTAVNCRLRTTFPVGSTLSGGLDSTSIAAVASRTLADAGRPKLQAFSAIFPSLAPDDLEIIDERRWIQAARDHLPLDGHDFEADRSGPFHDLPGAVEAMGGPIVPYNLYMHLGLYRMARDQGVRVFLDGIDGDTAVSHGFARFDELAQAGDWATLGRELEQLVLRSQWPERAVVKAQGLRLLGPVAASGQVRNWFRGAAELHRRFGIRRRHMLVHHGLRPVLKRNDDVPALTDQRRSHEAAIGMPLMQLVLEYADRAATRFGLEPAYPFFDRRLLEFSVGLPADQKLRDGWSRLILRRAMDGLLPAEVQWRHGKQSLFPNFRRDLTHRGRDWVRQATAGAPEWLAHRADAFATAFFAEGGGRPQTAALGTFRTAATAAWLRGRNASALSQTAPHGVS